MKLRTRAIVLTIGIILLFVLSQFLEFETFHILNSKVFKAFIVSLVYLTGLYWVLGYRIKGIRLITILGYSSYLVFIQSLFIELIVFQNIARLTQRGISFITLIGFGVSIYFLILTMNILNTSYISKIPLAQAAKATNFIYTLFGAYFTFLLISRIGIYDLAKIPIYILVVFLLTLNLFWFKKESFQQLFGETSAVVLFMSIIFITFIIWPLSVEVLSMLYTVIFYILLGLGLEERETTSFLMRVEYVLLFIVTVFVVLKLSVWGINGSIF